MSLLTKLANSSGVWCPLLCEELNAVKSNIVSVKPSPKPWSIVEELKAVESPDVGVSTMALPVMLDTFVSRLVGASVWSRPVEVGIRLLLSLGFVLMFGL